MMRIKAIALIAVLVALVGCSSKPKVTTGTIVKLKDVAAHTQLIPITHTICVGNPPACSTFITYIVEFIPEDWEVTLRACEGVEGMDNAKCHEDWYSIPQSVYKELQVGQSWTVPKDLQ